MTVPRDETDAQALYDLLTEVGATGSKERLDRILAELQDAQVWFERERKAAANLRAEIQEWRTGSLEAELQREITSLREQLEERDKAINKALEIHEHEGNTARTAWRMAAAIHAAFPILTQPKETGTK